MAYKINIQVLKRAASRARGYNMKDLIAHLERAGFKPVQHETLKFLLVINVECQTKLEAFEVRKRFDEAIKHVPSTTHCKPAYIFNCEEVSNA